MRHRRDTTSGPGDRAVLWMGVVVGLIPMVIALVRGDVWGAEPSLGLVVTLLSLLLLIRRNP